MEWEKDGIKCCWTNFCKLLEFLIPYKIYFIQQQIEFIIIIIYRPQKKAV